MNNQQLILLLSLDLPTKLSKEQSKQLADEFIFLEKRIAELEQELELMRNRVRDTFDYCEDVKKAMPKRDLEQQAKGVEDACDFANDKCINGGGYFGRDYESRFKQNGAFAFKSACMLYLKQLRNQAKGGDV